MGKYTRSDFVLDMFIVLIFDLMEPIVTLSCNVLLHNYQRVIDNHILAQSVDICLQFRDAESLRLCIWVDSASPGSTQHAGHFWTIVHLSSSEVKVCGSRHHACHCRYGITLGGKFPLVLLGSSLRLESVLLLESNWAPASIRSRRSQSASIAANIVVWSTDSLFSIWAGYGYYSADPLNCVNMDVSHSGLYAHQSSTWWDWFFSLHT